MQVGDLNRLMDIDGTVESQEYLFVQRTGEGLESGWKLERRELREKLISPRRMDEDLFFTAKQIASGADEGLALLAEHEGSIVALLLGQPRADTMELLDLRVDYDYRRQGLGLALVYQLIQASRQQGRRAIRTQVPANNFPATQLLHKCGFILAGLDTHRDSNHDLVKEAVNLLWCAELE
jgi:ribosomal protein S18 acetylase RimI-like enzyme